ncbi:hypothetical protein PR253_02470 [Metamycoplasma hyosynoviae]|uniref:hypothetical protein n=1 Tax=Metamycoplasma hyosynoviae TaxID=29559 RepID=UPI002359DB85|nr:hypothetical protein [Metamycoplasma hyosynoviae]MDC8920545.1 hypothetical protein [Metamycoplasma hyosynoviae]
MVYYGTNSAVKKGLPELKKLKSKTWNWLFHAANLISNLIIDIVSSAISILPIPGAKLIGNIVETTLGAISDIAIPLIFGRSVDYKEVGINATWRFFTIGSFSVLKGIRKIYKKIPVVNKAIRFFQRIASFAKNPVGLIHYVVNKTTYKLKVKLIKSLGRKQASFIIKGIRKAYRTTIKASVFTVSLLTAKNKEDFLRQRLSNLISFGIKKGFRIINKKIFIKGIKKLAASKFSTRESLKKYVKVKNQTWIPFYESKWIDGVKIVDDKWVYEEDQKMISYFVFFNKLATKNKKSLIFFNRPIEEFKEFLTTSDKGKWYLDNLAWGWEVGAAIRKKNKKPFLINKLEKTKYNQHFLSSVKQFENTTDNAIERLRDKFKVLSSARNRNLGNKIVIEWNDQKVDFFSRDDASKATHFDSKFLYKGKKMKSIKKAFSLVKSIKKI